MKQNLILIGMPTAGKSTVGVILAKMLGMDFLDTDLLIQKQTGQKLAEIIRAQGVEGFIRTEAAVLQNVQAENCVIATGGSAVYDEAAMRHLQSLGAVLYLALDYETLHARLHHAKQRGVVLREGQTLEALFAERTPLYEKYADLTVHEGAGGIEETVADILSLLENRAGFDLNNIQGGKGL